MELASFLGIFRVRSTACAKVCAPTAYRSTLADVRAAFLAAALPFAVDKDDASAGSSAGSIASISPGASGDSNDNDDDDDDEEGDEEGDEGSSSAAQLPFSPPSL